MPHTINLRDRANLLLLVVLFALFCGINFTRAGNAQFNKVLGMLPFVDPYLEMDFKNINPNLTERLAISQYPSLMFNCKISKSSAKPRVCWAAISRINNIAASHVAFYYHQGKLTRIKVALRERTYKEAIAHLDGEYGKHPTLIDTNGHSAGNLLVWSAGAGLIVSQAQTPKSGKPTLLWVNRVASGQNTFSGKHEQPHFFQKKLKPPTDV